MVWLTWLKLDNNAKKKSKKVISYYKLKNLKRNYRAFLLFLLVQNVNEPTNFSNKEKNTNIDSLKQKKVSKQI